MFKKALSVGSKKLRSITSLLLAICLMASMFAGITVPVQADTSTVGKMVEVYNQNPTWAYGESFAATQVSLPAGTYELSANYKHEGGWVMQAAVYSNNNWIQAPGATVTESQNEYFTTIIFTLTQKQNVWVRFVAPQSTNKLWLANVTLRNVEETTNLLKNGDFTVGSNGLDGWGSNNTSFNNKFTTDITEGFFEKGIEPLSGNMMQVYNQSGWGDQLLYRYAKSLPAGTYKISSYFKHEGDWKLQVFQSSDEGKNYTQISGAKVTESEDKYYTTITFTLNSTAYVKAQFNAPTSQNKLWVANFSLQRISGGDVGSCKNFFGNSDFTVTRDGLPAGLAFWTFTNLDKAFANAKAMPIEDGIFDKGVEPLSGNMMQVHNQSGWGDQLLYRYAKSLPAGTYQISAYYKQEGGWSMKALQSSTENGSYTQISGAKVVESEDKYYTTITFTLTSTAFVRAQFNAPTNTNKLWLANLSLRRISGGDVGSCKNFFGNSDFTVTRDGLPAGLAFWNFTNFASAFANAQAKTIEDGFFDKDNQDMKIDPPSGKMMEAYNINNWADQFIYRRIYSLPAGTYKLSAYFKHEGGWSMQAQVENNGSWIQAPGATVTESESEYLTTITFTLTATTNFRAVFKAPKSKSKLWLDNLVLRHISGGELGRCANYYSNGDFSNEINYWTFDQDAQFNRQTKVVEDGFFDKPTGIELPTGKMLTANKAAGHVKLGIAQYINSLPAGTYELSSYFKQTGGWNFNIETWQDDANDWMPIADSVSEMPEGWHFKSISFTLNTATNVRIKFTAPETEGSVWIANVKLLRTDGLDIGNSKGYVNNGYFLDNTTGWTEDDYEDKITNIETVDIPQDWFFITLSNQEIFDCITKILCKQATQEDYPDSDYDRNGITDIVDLLMVEQRMLAGASAEANVKRAAIINSKSGITNTSTVRYVSENGNDSTGDGSKDNPYKTIAMANMGGTKVTVLLERGGTYRLTSAVELNKGFKYGAYGEGAKPVVSGSPQDFKTATWTPHSENIWKVSYPYSDAGVVVFNNGESWGCKKFGNDAMGQLLTEGDYYHDHDGSVLYLYSSENPATKYNSIEIGCNTALFNITSNGITRTDIYIDNISFKYTGQFGVRAQNANGLYITNCEFGWIGGSLQTASTRFGNGIELWNGQQNVTVKNNWFYQIYDSGFTFQGDSSYNKSYKNIICNNNLFENNKMSFEFWHQDDGFTFENIQFNNNISRLAGYGQCEQTIDFWLAAHVYADYRTTGTVNNFTIQNNIFDTSKLYMAWMWLDADAASSNILGAHSISQNTYYHKQSANAEAIYVGDYTYATNQAQLEDAVALFDVSPKKVVWLGFDS